MQFTYESAGTHNVDRRLLQSGETNNLLVASLLPIFAAVSVEHT